MHILIKNKNILFFNDFEFKCCIGKNGLTKNKIEGDKKTPIGVYNLGSLFYRKDRNGIINTKLKKKIITKSMGWCDDIKNSKYNKLIRISKKKVKHEKMYRKDNKYDLLIPIKYNMLKPIKNKGSAIFIHLTENYKPTAGCIALKKNDFLILLKLINKKTKIRII
jgi:L,D-peptidoglycan transpeptidase YkuD (ErfK/YbiS/YcfS/YnhG family)